MSSSSRRCLQLLEKCKSMSQLRQAHAQAITCGLKDNSFTLSRLLAFCSDPVRGSLNYSWKVFQTIQNPTTCICNSMIKAFLLKGENFALNTFKVYSFMLRNGMHPDAYTLTYLLKACVKLKSFCLGELLHGSCLKLGFVVNNFVGNSLISMYFGFGDVGGARCVFDEVVVGLCADVVSWTLMVSGYAKFGDVGMARLLFDEAPQKDSGVWGAMVSGYLRNNCFKECLYMFRLMQLSGVVPDEGILLNVLCACAQLGALDAGVWIHRYFEIIGLPLSVRLGTGLIDMYAKCGNLDLAKGVFDTLCQRDSVCWNVMIFGLAMHGDGEGALKLFSQMEDAGCWPDDLTFIAVLSACSHSGMVYEGLGLLDRMCRVYNTEPKREHYGCMVHLLSRAGLLREAKQIIERMPGGCSFSEEAVAWRTLLSACCNQGQGKLAEVAAERFLQLEHHSGVYVLLSNWYAAAGKHEDAKRIKKMMRNMGVEKAPGCSSIKINGIVHEFVAREETNPQMEDIESVLVKMNNHFNHPWVQPIVVQC